MERPRPIDSLEPLPDRSGLALAEGEIHVWYCCYEEGSDPPMAKRYDALMTAEERARGKRYMFERDTRQHLMTRALVRTTLSRYAEIAPEAWRFDRGERGKPFVCGPEGVPPISFNLSNTHGLVACAVSRSFCDIGVDVEDHRRKVDALALAKGHFAPFELAAMRAESKETMPERFFSYWTLKESYIKARGLGLAIPLRQFWFHLDEGPVVRIEMDPALDDEANDWWFDRFAVAGRYRLSLAARCPAKQTPRLRARECVPLMEESK